jgi:malonyl-CoA/methylmalonyl-CoA synthetase
MTQFFKSIQGHARNYHIAVVDPPTSAGGSPTSITYATLLSRVGSIRDHLLRISSTTTLNGARIALMALPGSDFVAGLFAIWSVNAIAVPLCLSHPTQELAYTLSDSETSVIIFHPNFQSKLAPLLRGRKGVCLSQVSNPGRTDFGISRLPVPESGAALIGYTSGSTGKPKGVVHTHKSLQYQCRSLVEAWQISPRDRVLHVLPLHHTHGLIVALLAPLFAGARVEFMEKFDDSRVWQRLLSNSEPVTILMAVPTIWVRLIQYFDRHFIKNPGPASQAAAKLRLTISGSAALPIPVRQRWADITGGQLLLERYGMTETGIIYSGGLEQSDRIRGSVGWPLPYVETRLMTEDGRDVSSIPNTVGEIQVRGPGMFRGYWRRPKETVETYTEDGWLKTGDMAVVKKEFNNALFIQGRASVDIIKSGGYKISALEIETEILSLPIIKEAVVVGVEDDQWGECVAAIVVPTDEVCRIACLNGTQSACDDCLCTERVCTNIVPFLGRKLEFTVS